MGQSTPLTEMERERLYQGRLQGKTMCAIAAELDRSVHVVRKWWQRVRHEGLQGLRTQKPGPSPQGVLSRFDPRVAPIALNLKRTHRRWGADRVLVEMSQDHSLEWVGSTEPEPPVRFLQREMSRVCGRLLASSTNAFGAPACHCRA